MTGKLIFDTENEQFIQINKEKEIGYSYPIAQAERHQEYLKKLMSDHKFPQVPIDHLVVISNNYASYVITGKNTHKVKPRVGKADVFNNKMKYFENLYSNPILTSKDLRKLSRMLVKMNTVPTDYILNKYEINKADLVTGVFGPACKHVPLIRKKQKWYCSKCDEYSTDAHLQALMDYFLLIDTKITNQQFREFAHLDSPYIAKRILQSVNLNFSGTNKVRTYYPKTIPW